MKWYVVGVMIVLFGVRVDAVTLEWDAPAVGVVDNYNMYRQVVPGGVCGTAIVPSFELHGSVPGSQKVFTDTTTVIGANYYHVTASNSGGESLPSNQVCFQMVQKTSAPQNLRIR